MSSSKIKVIQWFTGEIARHQIRVVTRCPSMELVGAFVYHGEKAGMDVGEIAGIDPIGVAASNDADEVLALDAMSSSTTRLSSDTTRSFGFSRAART